MNTPDVTKGELPAIDEETGEEINPERLRACLKEYGGLISFFRDVDSGLIAITLSEYRRIPAMTLDLWKLYKALRVRLGNK